MPDYIPPYIPPTDKLRLSRQSLRNARDCVMKNWTAEVYSDRFSRIPMMSMLMVMDEIALHEVFVTQASNFPQSAIFRRIVKPIWRNGILTSEGDDWRWQRQAAAPAFKPSAAQAVVPHASIAAKQLVTRWIDQTQEPFDIVPGLADLATHVVFDALLDGGKGEDVSEFLASAESLSSIIGQIRMADILGLPNWTRRFFGAPIETPAAALHAYVSRALAAGVAKDAAPDSLLHMLAAASDPETGRSMDDDRLEDNIVGSLSAGRDTTAVTLGWTLYLIANHRPTYERIMAEIDTVVGGGKVLAEHLDQLAFTRAVLMETLRLFPPGPQLARDCLADTEIAGQAVKRGTMVLIPVYALHRHLSYWDRPNVFEPERFMGDNFIPREHRYSYMPFGAGSRICLGMAFAMAEAQTVLATLLQELHFESADIDNIEFESAVLRAKHGLLMRVTARN